MAMRSVLVAVLAYTWADSDLWGHVKFGGDIMTAGSIPRVDPYSFTSGKLWVNHEWLTEVTMDIAYAMGGMAGLVALKVALVAGAMAFVFTSLRRQTIPPVARDVLLGVVVVGASNRLSAVRPQLYSLLLLRHSSYC